MRATISAKVRSLRRWMRQDRIVRRIRTSASLLTAGEKLTKKRPVLLLASRGRNVYPRNVNCSCSNEPERPESLQYTSRVFTGCSSSPHSASRDAMAFQTARAWALLRQCTTTSSQYRSNVTAGWAPDPHGGSGGVPQACGGRGGSGAPGPAGAGGGASG